MTAFTYHIKIPVDLPTLPAGCGNAAASAFVPCVPVNLKTYARQFGVGDTITFDLHSSITAATMFTGPGADSNSSTIVSPFVNQNTSFSIMPVNGINLTVTVAEPNGAWELWCELSTNLDKVPNFYIADPEVQTQTGGTPP